MPDAVTLFEASRHEPLRPVAWDEDRARATIAHIVDDCERRFTREHYWPQHPRDADGGTNPESFWTDLYCGTAGVFWALHYLQAVGAVRLSRGYLDELDLLLARNRAWLGTRAVRERASFLAGDTPIRMLAYGENPTADLDRELQALIAGNLDHPARELMWGSPGTMLASMFLHERTQDAAWADLFRRTASKLWSQLEWSAEHDCAYWTQEMAGWKTMYLGAVHGFVGTALPLIRGRRLLDPEAWAGWERCIAGTVTRTAIRVQGQANWPGLLSLPQGWPEKTLMQFCHGAPGFVVSLADFPSASLDALLLEAGEAIWAAGPITKGSNLCHGTGGNRYAFLKLYGRTRERRWLERARSFAMHGIEQMHDDAARYGQLRYSLWTGDPGFAIYLWDCVEAIARFPTLDVFYTDERSGAELRFKS